MKKRINFILISLASIFVACDGNESFQAERQETPKLGQAKAGPVENIETSERIEAAALTEATSTFQQERKLLAARIRGAFDELNFDFLEEQAGEFREDQSLFSDGSWKLTHFYEAIGKRFHSGDAGYLKDLNTFESWERAYPNSTTRRVALVDFLVDYAWQARGSGYSHTVTAEGWRLFGERLNYAWKILSAMRQSNIKDPYGYELAITTAMGIGLDMPDFETILSESRLHFPTYYSVETKRAYSLLPRWNGKVGDWEAFAKEAAQVKDGLGDEIYARILIKLKRFYVHIFRDTKADWVSARSGLKTLNHKYPNSLEIQNYTAYFAVLGNDRELAKEYFDKLGSAYLKKVWGKPERFVHFRTWAKTGRW